MKNLNPNLEILKKRRWLTLHLQADRPKPQRRALTRSFRISRLGIKNSEEGGFTLIELLIYVAIFATMIGAVVGLALLSSSQKVISQNTADLNYQGEAVMAIITQTVRRSTAITSPATANTSGSLTLAMAAPSVNPTVFSSATDATTTRMRISEGSPAVNNSLTNGRVTLSNLTFTNMSNPSTKGSIQIRFTLSYRTTSPRPELQLSKTFYGAATIP